MKLSMLGRKAAFSLLVYTLVSIVVSMMIFVSGDAGSEQPEINGLVIIVTLGLTAFLWKGASWPILPLFVGALLLIGVSGPEVIESADPVFVTLAMLAIAQALLLVRLWDQLRLGAPEVRA